MTRKNYAYWTAIAVGIATAVSVSMSRSKEVAQARTESAAATMPIVTVGDPSTARWTATTYEAAASEANKKVLAQGRRLTVTGEIVDVSCYLQLGKRGEGHIACGSKCIAAGEPIGIVDADTTLYVLFAEEHHPRRDGQVSLKNTVGSLLAKKVTVTGMMTENRGNRALFLQAAEIDSVMHRAQGEKK